MISDAKWKWLVESPLSASWRRRLEITLGVVASAAAVVTLSAFVKPAPEKVAELHGRKPLVSSVAPPYVPRSPYEPPETPPAEFYRALEKGDTAAMSRLYRHGMVIDGLLSTAVQAGKKPVVEWFLDHGVSVSERYRTDQILIEADEHPEIVKLLLERGASEPSLDAVISANAPNAFARQLAKSPKLDERGTSYVESAASVRTGTASTRRHILETLLAGGADPNRGYRGGALAGAVASCDADNGNESLASDCLEIVDLLVDRGAKPTGEELANAISLSDEAKRTVLVDKLMAMPTDKHIRTVALASASSARLADVKRLVAKGVDWAYHDGEEDEVLPLFNAASNNRRDLVKMYLDAGAPADLHYKAGASALMAALDNSAMSPDAARIVELLVEKGANANRRLPDGRTPLFAAAEAGSTRVVSFLLSKGARVDDRVLDDTALDAAESHGNQAAARIIHAHGGHRAHPQYGYGYGN